MPAAPATPASDARDTSKTSDTSDTSDSDTNNHDRLSHELSVCKVALELQNDELRHARQAAEAALGRYFALFDFAPIGYAMLDTERTIVEINREGLRLLGCPRSHAIGRHFAVFVDPDQLRGFNELLDAVGHDSESHSQDSLLSRAGAGNPVPVRLIATQLRGEQPRTLLAFGDISERKAKEAENERAEHDLRELNRRKDDFLATLSHELRNPLSPIRTSVGVLRAAPADSEAAHQALEIIDRSAAHLARLVDELLDVTRITRGSIQLCRECVELTALVRQVVADQRELFAATRIGLDTDEAAGEQWIVADRARVVQMLTQLLSNARKFTPAGGKATVAVTRDGDRVLMHVRDTGIGIAPELLLVLGQPFVQAKQGLDRKDGGLGLGLATVRLLAELHDGQLAIHSRGIGRGSEITVTFRAAAPAPAIPAEKPARSPQRRVLIIEDNIDVVTSIRVGLTLKGHIVASAETGELGLEQALSFQPDVVLCDLGLPGMDGFAVARELAKHESLRACYLVALTGYARPEDIARCKAAGFHRHLAKPASLEELEEVLAAADVMRPMS